MPRANPNNPDTWCNCAACNGPCFRTRRMAGARRVRCEACGHRFRTTLDAVARADECAAHRESTTARERAWEEAVEAWRARTEVEREKVRRLAEGHW